MFKCIHECNTHLSKVTSLCIKEIFNGKIFKFVPIRTRFIYLVIERVRLLCVYDATACSLIVLHSCF